MAAQDLAPGDELTRSAGASRLEADEEEAVRRAVQLGLHRLVGDPTGALHAIDPGYEFAGVARNARGFGERPFGVGLDDPEVGIRGARLLQRVVDQATVDAGHHDDDAEQEAQAEIGQHEAQEIVLDVAIGEVHGDFSPATFAARPTRSLLASCVTTSACSGTPPVIS